MGDYTVYVVEDDGAMRDSLATVFQVAGHEVACFESAEACLAQFEPQRAGCFIIDLKLPGIDGIALHTRLTAAGNRAPSYILTGHGDVRRAVEAIKAGVTDFFEKPFDPEQLVAVATDAKNQSDRLHGNDALLAAMEARIGQLTSREKEVLYLVADGLTNKDMANRLSISPRTVEIHRARVMQKLEARSIADIVRLLARIEGPHTGS